MTPLQPTRTLTSLVRDWAPHLRVLSVSNPEPHLEPFNVVATTEDESVARKAVLQLEGEEIDDARIGVVTLGRAETVERDGVDPEGVGRWLAPRVVLGGMLGALAGAVIGAALAALAGAEAAVVVAAALAGAALLAVPGAIWLTFPRLGGSDAYRQTFVDRNVDALNIVSLHTSNREEAERAMDRVAAEHGVEVWLLDADGRQMRRTSSR
jgi:hypothetical protein